MAKSLIELLYGPAELMVRFGRTDVSRTDIEAHFEKLCASWPSEELILNYNSENLSWICRESKKLGLFTVRWEIKGMKIVVRAADTADLSYLTLKHNNN